MSLSTFFGRVGMYSSVETVLSSEVKVLCSRTKHKPPVRLETGITQSQVENSTSE